MDVYVYYKCYHLNKTTFSPLLNVHVIIQVQKFFFNKESKI